MLATAAQRGTDDLLRLTGRIDVRGVDEVDSGVQRPMDDPNGLLMVGIAPLTEHHGAEAEGTDLDAGTAERAHFHGLCVHPGVERPLTGHLLPRRRRRPRRAFRRLRLALTPVTAI